MNYTCTDMAWTQVPSNMIVHDIDGLDSFDSYELTKMFIKDGYSVKVVKTGKDSNRVMAEKLFPIEEN